MKQLSAFVFLIIALAMGTVAPRSQTRASVEQPVADRAAAGDIVSIIVGVDATFIPEGYLPDTDAVASQRDNIARVLDDVMTRAADSGATVGSSYEILPFFTARVDRAALEVLAAMPGVISIAENTLDQADLASSVPIVNAAPAWTAGHTGAGWSVAVIDTGIEATHGFLAGKVVAEACYMDAGGAGSGSSACPGGSFAAVGPGTGAPCNANGCDHGTHVAGIATGFNAVGTGINGVAPGASLIALQAFTRHDDPFDCGSAQTPCALSYVSDQVLALNRVVVLAGAGNVNKIASVNMSLGGGNFSSQTTCDNSNLTNGRKAAIDNVRSLGIAVVASGGNSAFRTALGAPGCISSAVSVGSITDAGLVSSFSNNAPFLSLFAPGSDITSSVTGNTFGSKNGTSMAAPHVAGAWAILKQALPGATVTAALAALQTTGTTINDTRINPGGGSSHPLININNARLTLLGTPVPTGPPGAPTSFAATVSGSNLNMTWTAPAVTASLAPLAAAATNYNLVVRLASGGPIAGSLPLGNVTTFNVNAPNGTFFLSVQGTNASGPGPESNVVGVTVPTVPSLPTPPGPPTNLVGTVVGNSATFTWVAPTSGGPVANYVIVAGLTPNFTTPLGAAVLPVSPTSLPVGGIANGVYYARVFARNAGGDSAPSNEVTIVIGATAPPGAPTLNAPTVSGSNVGLSWSPGAGPAPTSYTLFVATTPGGAPVGSLALTGTSVSFPGVPSGNYFLKLVANNSAGASPPSLEVPLTVP